MINVKNLQKNLYTKIIPNPDILIRTGGKKDLVIFYFGNWHILKFTLLISFGQILILKDYRKIYK